MRAWGRCSLWDGRLVALIRPPTVFRVKANLAKISRCCQPNRNSFPFGAQRPKVANLKRQATAARPVQPSVGSCKFHDRRNGRCEFSARLFCHRPISRRANYRASASPPANLKRKHRPKTVPPEPHRLVRDINAHSRKRGLPHCEGSASAERKFTPPNGSPRATS